MSLAMRYHSEPMRALASLPQFSVTRERSATVMAALQERSEEEIAQRIREGHRAYVMRVDGDAAGWGWVATRTATIGELGTALTMPARDRYLWNFVTLPAHRGKGLYPRLLQAIMNAEAVEAERFWIAYAPENHASASGIAKAGFRVVADLSFDDEGKPALHPVLPAEARVATQMLPLPAKATRLAPCWRCVRAGRREMTCADGACLCDYQQPKSGCES